MTTSDFTKIKAPYHWHPTEDYCIKCGKFVNYFGQSKSLVVECACFYENSVHYVRQQIHYICLDEIKKEMGREKIFVWEAFKHLGIELPLK